THYKHHGLTRVHLQLDSLLYQLDDLAHVWAGFEQPDLRLHREGMAALLDDRGALAVVLAEDDQRAAQHAGRSQVGERVGGDIGAHRRLEGHRAAHRVVERRPEHRHGARFGSLAVLVDAALLVAV